MGGVGVVFHHYYHGNVELMLGPNVELCFITIVGVVFYL